MPNPMKESEKVPETTEEIFEELRKVRKANEKLSFIEGYLQACVDVVRGFDPMRVDPIAVKNRAETVWRKKEAEAPSQ